ncbi:hypothetical protein CgunFtcFv8_027911 [Champsocephalus gunnari]|uniref:Uncharacterized protein n=2 Tax=Champsocephalus gunnari TaxID=52237 RepID=A0AAN8IG98_CHAGU|nr:hypothetical protein CgunFtcFv8_027911 [Champsocephalus gunnari]
MNTVVMDSEFQEVGQDNTSSILVPYSAADDIKAFLIDGTIVTPFNASTVKNSMKVCDYIYDLDGVCIELDRLSAIKAGLHYLHLKNPKGKLVGHYHILKKHFHLRRMSNEGRKAIKKILGLYVSVLDGGYFLNFTIVPEDLNNPDPKVTGLCRYEKCGELLTDVWEAFRGKLKALGPADMARDTVRKNSWKDLSNWNILPQDQEFILNLLDEAIVEANKNYFARIMITITKFGQKQHEPLILSQVADVRAITKVSVHAAVVIAAKDNHTHLLWSRVGLEDQLGHDGTLYSTLSIFEAVNYSSNMDGKPHKWSKKMRNLFTPVNITFLQLYCDAPHNHLKSAFAYKHPVSGCIVTCGLCHKDTNKAMLSRALDYIEHVEEMAKKMVGQIHLRMEVVGLFEKEDGIPSIFVPEEFFRLPAIDHLMSTIPLVLPFLDEANGEGLPTVIRDILEYLGITLRKGFDSHLFVGGFLSSWTTYQAELAVEETLWGHPLSNLDTKWSVSLGTDTISENSLTYMRGFLALAPPNSASVESEPPPLSNWTHDPLQVTRILRVFILGDTLEAAPSLVGAQIIRIFLGDIYKRNDRIPLGAMAGTTPPGKLKGSVHVDKVVEDLATRDSFHAPDTFGRARNMCMKRGIDITECLMLGFLELKLKFFPAFTLRDVRKKKILGWNGTDWYELCQRGQASSKRARAAYLTGDVCIEIERRNLSYSRNLEIYRDNGMPWMEPILLRLPPKMEATEELKVLTFLTCVGMLMNNDYVVYEQLKTLVTELPFSQARMQVLKLQSAMMLPKVLGTSIWKLADDIPYRMNKQPAKPKPATKAEKPEEEEPQQPVEDVQGIDLDEEPPTTPTQKSRCLPVTSKRLWSVDELGFIDHKGSLRDAYTSFVKKCQAAGTPVRNMGAFKRRRNRTIAEQQHPSSMAGESNADL